MAEFDTNLEKFYAGTIQTGGVVHTQGARSSTGQPIQVPISGQSYITPEGWTVPYASSPNEVMFIVDGKPVGMTLTNEALRGLEEGTLTPSDIIQGSTAALQQQKPSYVSTPLLPPLSNIVQPRYAPLPTDVTHPEQIIPPPFYAGQFTGQAATGSTNLDVVTRPTPVVEFRDMVPYSSYTRPLAAGETISDHSNPISNILTGAAQLTGYGQSEIEGIVTLRGIESTADVQYAPVYDQFGQVTETAREWLTPSYYQDLPVTVTHRGMLGEALTYGALTSVLDPIALATGARPTLLRQPTGSEQVLQIYGSVGADIAIGAGLGKAWDLALPAMRKRGILAPQEYDAQVLIAWAQVEEWTELSPTSLSRRSGWEFDSAVQPYYMKFKAREIEFIIPDELKGSYLTKQFSAPVIPDDTKLPRMSRTEWDIGKFDWNVETGFNIKSVQKGFEFNPLTDSWPSNLKVYSRAGFGDLQGVYKDSGIPLTIMDTAVKIKASKGSSTVAYDLAQSYKKTNLVQPTMTINKVKLPTGKLTVAGESLQLSKVTAVRSRLEGVGRYYSASGATAFYDETYIRPEIKGSYTVNDLRLTSVSTGSISKIDQSHITILQPRRKYKRLQVTGQSSGSINSPITVQSTGSKLDRLQVSSQLQTNKQAQRVDTSLALGQSQIQTSKTAFNRFIPNIPNISLRSGARGSISRRSRRRSASVRLPTVRIGGVSRSPRSDPLSVEMAASSLYSKGKRPIPQLLGGKKAWKYFKRRGGFRVPTISQIGKPIIKRRKGRKKYKTKWF